MVACPQQSSLYWGQVPPEGHLGERTTGDNDEFRLGLLEQQNPRRGMAVQSGEPASVAYCPPTPEDRRQRTRKILEENSELFQMLADA